MIMNTVKKAVIPCAGYGTRFLPATKAIPKEMLPIVDVPTLHYIVKEVVDSGITDIMIVTSKNKPELEKYFDRNVDLEQVLARSGKTEEIDLLRKISDMANISYVRQQEMKGAGDAVLLCKNFVGNEPFALLYGDDLMYSDVPVTKQLINAYQTTGKCIVGVQAIDRSLVHLYGVVEPGANKGKYTEIKSFVEKPTIGTEPSNLASLGRYVLTSEVFEVLESIREQIEKSKSQTELYVTDAIDVVARTTGAYAYEFDGKRYDIGNKMGYLKAVTEFALRSPLGKEYEQYLKTIIK